MLTQDATQDTALMRSMRMQPMALPSSAGSKQAQPLSAHIDGKNDGSCQITLPVVGQGGNAHALHLQVQASDNTAAACEWWAAGEASHELSLHHGWYHGLDRFRDISRQVHFPHGSGMPGRAWALGAPVLMNNVARNTRFLRSSGADNEGLKEGLAWPLIIDQRLHGVLVLLTGANSHIFPLVEIWQPRGQDGIQRIAYLGGQHHATIAAGDSLTLAEDSQDPIAQAVSTGQPQCGGIAEESQRSQAMHDDGVKHSCALPCLVGQKVQSVLHLAC